MLASVHIFFADAIPDLLPAEAPLPPTSWEQDRLAPGLILFAALLMAFFLWQKRRNQPAHLSPTQIASKKLQELQTAPNNSYLAGLVLQVLRQYLSAKLAWPATELNAEEIVSHVREEKDLPSDLANEIAALIYQCQERQFSAGRMENVNELPSRSLAVIQRIESITNSVANETASRR